MSEKKKADPGSTSGMTKRVPRWTIAFLRALERTGEVEAAARDAGIDKSSAYARRKAHADFAQAWEDALRLRSGRAEAQVQEKVGFWQQVKSEPLSLSGSAGVPSPAEGRGAAREELLASTSLGGQMKRGGPGRWNQAAEARFFDELAATANVRRAAEAAGVSKNAVYARRMKRADFRAKWDAVLETGRSAIEMHLVEAAKKSFDPEELDTGEVQPNVSVTEAIRIVQLHGSKAQRQEQERLATQQSEEASAEELEEARERLFNKLERLRKREWPHMLAQGWSHDESRDQLVPPGWVWDPDYKPLDAGTEAGPELPQ
jgi:hypothetical protein